MPKAQSLVSPKWQEGEATVLVGNTNQQVEAKGLNILAVHRGIGSRNDRWAISNTITGTAVFHLQTEILAMQIAEILEQECQEALLVTNFWEMREKFGPWVHPWLIASRQQEKCLGVEQFKQQYGDGK
jgi:hypothetical protein